MCAGALGGQLLHTTPPRAPPSCAAAAAWGGGGARRVHGGLSTGRVAAAPAGLRYPSGFHVCVVEHNLALY